MNNVKARFLQRGGGWRRRAAPLANRRDAARTNSFNWRSPRRGPGPPPGERVCAVQLAPSPFAAPPSGSGVS